MLSFLLTIYLAFAYNPYVRTLRRPHQQTGAAQQGPNPYMFGEYDMGDLFEDYLPLISGTMSGMRGGSTGVSPFSGMSNIFSPLMNNPFGMNMQKCMDNDMCTSWVNRQMFSTGGSTGSGSGAAATGSGSGADAASTGSGSGAAASGAGAGAMTGGYSPTMVGFPQGFNPAYYGLDWDSRPVDCMDDSKCARGLMMYSSGRGIGSNIAQMLMGGFSSRLQKPRRLSRPQYGVPYRYGHY